MFFCCIGERDRYLVGGGGHPTRWYRNSKRAVFYGSDSPYWGDCIEKTLGPCIGPPERSSSSRPSHQYPLVNHPLSANFIQGLLLPMRNSFNGFHRSLPHIMSSRPHLDVYMPSVHQPGCG